MVKRRWPLERDGHAACCLNYGDDHPKVLIFGGVDKDGKVLRDMWILDIDSGKWTEVWCYLLIPKVILRLSLLCFRCTHPVLENEVSAFTLSPPGGTS